MRLAILGTAVYRSVSEAGRRLEKNLRKVMRERILARDVTCVACRPDMPGDDEALHVAHITPMAEFRSRLGLVTGTEQSFRDDNLVLLCVPCHAVQETIDRAADQPLASWYRDYLDEMHPGKTLAQVPGFAKSRDRVVRLFEERKTARGWRTVDDLAARENLEPDSGFVVGPTFRTVDVGSLPPGRSMTGQPMEGMRAAIGAAGGRLLREGRAADFVDWYEAKTRGTDNQHGGVYPFAYRQAATVIFQRPVEESLIGKIGRHFEKAGCPERLVQLRVDENLYLLHAHPA
ncbi:MAG: HNH endonuclease [Thermoplasmatota archaeon]